MAKYDPLQKYLTNQYVKGIKQVDMENEKVKFVYNGNS